VTGPGDYEWARKIGTRTYNLPTSVEMLGLKSAADALRESFRESLTISSPSADLIWPSAVGRGAFKELLDDVGRHNSAYFARSFDTNRFSEQIMTSVTLPESPIKEMIERVNQQARGMMQGSPADGQRLAENVKLMHAQLSRPDIEWFRREVIDPAVADSLDEIDVAADQFVQHVEDYVAANSPNLDAVVEDLLAGDTELEAKVKMTTGWQTLVDRMSGVAEAKLVRSVIIYVLGIGVFFLPSDAGTDVGTYAGVVALLLATFD
jgi:hypothetical protein